MVNVPKLKGIHYAIESGRLAAETIYAQLKNHSTDFSAYETEIYDGAGHGFLRAQSGREGANMKATGQAWPRTIEFLRKHLN